MASTRYEMDFGDAQASGSPAFEYFVRQDTGVALTPPAIVVAPWGHGAFYFDWDWATAPTGVQTISWKAVVNGVEQSDVISGVLPPGQTIASGGVSSLAPYSQASEIINRTAVQCGLSSVADPFASTDPNFVQFVELLNTFGEDLNNYHDWTQFIRECSITTANSNSAYALPDDFHEMIDQSGWNRTMRLPMIGPLSGQEAQFLKTRLGTVIINVAFRLQGNQLVFPVVPSNGQTLVFEYVSDFWVQSAASSTGPDLDHAQSATDYVLYDPNLMVAGLRLYWLDLHGFDTASAKARYDERLAHSIGKNVGARMIDMAGSGLNADRLLDQGNVPITNYGI